MMALIILTHLWKNSQVYLADGSGSRNKDTNKLCMCKLRAQIKASLQQTIWSQTFPSARSGREWLIVDPRHIPALPFPHCKPHSAGPEHPELAQTVSSKANTLHEVWTLPRTELRGLGRNQAPSMEHLGVPNPKGFFPFSSPAFTAIFPLSYTFLFL